jgi:hypothetical protein
MQIDAPVVSIESPFNTALWKLALERDPREATMPRTTYTDRAPAGTMLGTRHVIRLQPLDWDTLGVKHAEEDSLVFDLDDVPTCACRRPGDLIDATAREAREIVRRILSIEDGVQASVSDLQGGVGLCARTGGPDR